MRLICTFFILLFTQTTQAQKLKGIWQGYFVQKEFNQITGKFMEDKYRYEIQINQLPNNSLEGVTYSYKTTVFYGKSSFKGIYTPSTKNLLVKETKMLELKIASNTEPCLMTCYLDYRKEGKKEILAGTYTSLNADKKTDCGEGTIYLVRVPESDFELEPFLQKNKPPVVNNQKKDSAAGSKAITLPVKPKAPNVAGGKNNQPVQNSIPNALKTGTLKTKPGLDEFKVQKPVITKDSIKTVLKTRPADTASKPLPKLPEASVNKITIIPKVLQERENRLVNTIQVDVKDVQIDYYDNGQIDNDTITVYLNNIKVINSQKLTYSPITLHLQLDENHPLQEVITVADNLGDIPPNTALMVITAGKKRYEVTIASDEKRNAKVLIEYKPSGVKVH